MMFVYLSTNLFINTLSLVSQVAECSVFNQQFGAKCCLNMAWHASHSQSRHNYYVVPMHTPL